MWGEPALLQQAEGKPTHDADRFVRRKESHLSEVWAWDRDMLTFQLQDSKSVAFQRWDGNKTPIQKGKSSKTTTPKVQQQWAYLNA